MKELTDSQMQMVDGAGAWGEWLTGFGCGAGLVVVGIAMASPEPFSKAAVASYILTGGGCLSYFV